jgi:threonine/homoserine/homoserine lactone efflux protein
MGILTLLSVGFVLGLTGAMAPGPLLTLTITESARRGGIVGPLLVLGHGILELAVLVLIVFGLGSFLHHQTVFAVISFVGGGILVYMGIDTIRGLRHYALISEVRPERRQLHPVLAGIVISASNPYWFIWWLTIGTGYVIFAKQLGIHGIAAFFTGHIAADLAWYTFVSYGMHLGGRYLKTRVVKAILFACSLFLVFFGLFFIIKGIGFL